MCMQPVVGIDQMVGIDIGGNRIKMGAFRETPNGLLKVDPFYAVPFPKGKGHEGVKEVVGAYLKEIFRQRPDVTNAPGKLYIGVGTPGPINSQWQKVLTTPNLKDLDCFLVGDWLRNRYPGAKVLHANDGNISSAYFYCDWARWQYNTVVAIAQGAGTGVGVCQEGKIFTGSHGNGAECGHSIVYYGNGVLPLRKCSCGGWGHAEAYLGERCVTEWVTEAALSTDTCGTFLYEAAVEDKVTMQLISEAADLGDPLALQAQREMDEALSRLIGEVIVKSYEPDVVGLCGGVSNGLTDLRLNQIRENVSKMLMPSIDPPEIEKVEIPDQGGLLGAGYALRYGMHPAW